MLFGVVNINEQAAINTNLDEESLNMIAQYDAQFDDFRSNFSSRYNSSKSLTGFEPDANQVGDFAKDFFETKNRVDQLKSTVNLVFNVPDLFFLSIPFVDEQNLTLYKQVSMLLLIIVVFTSVILAFFGRIWGNK
jgi:hypothetical protein